MVVIPDLILSCVYSPLWTYIYSSAIVYLLIPYFLYGLVIIKSTEKPPNYGEIPDYYSISMTIEKQNISGHGGGRGKSTVFKDQIVYCVGSSGPNFHCHGDFILELMHQESTGEGAKRRCGNRARMDGVGEPEKLIVTPREAVWEMN